ncbi:3-deoxy-7-phosphoheptulonate synthase [Ktedonobacter sp. SOSP1-52]|uniref:3-deoxy-7-phosphoheptulonate synthase n=1 Tax=Ktedonobacter sp. SOSP1-52 TaxID=2778366 RepID=UPI001914F6C5|nr:3-deoxy-7-phosphoheptulonate synthase [Ktedonobacter sp. SOSP1-52]GHO65453.1 3-deoxy-7-phosphoheptulonate synthase [Ktedonobacter sp. SOSP1-52]
MILNLRPHITEEERDQVLAQVSHVTGHPSLLPVEIEGRQVLALDASHFDWEARSMLAGLPGVESIIPIPTPYKLVSRHFKAERSAIVVGNGAYCNPVTIGGTELPTIIAGPCAVESRGQILLTASAVKSAGAHILRGGAYKPRTSPYQFQGLGIEGLWLLAEAREATGLPTVTEVMEPELVETVAQYADLLQIGARNMQNYPLLRACGQQRQKRPVLLKRGLSATITELLLAAEYIVASGNPNVILCERGIRSYDTATRNVLDLTAIPLLNELTHLPVIVDPSHATGKSSLVPTMARASIVAGSNGIIVEVHCDPDQALCDAQQAITPYQLRYIAQDAINLARFSPHTRESERLKTDPEPVQAHLLSKR